MNMLEHVAQWLVDFVHHFGYIGLFIMCALESTFAPIPSEVTMIPAGYLVQQGQMNFWLVMLVSITGTVFGSLVNYWIALHLGRRVLLRFGRYFFLDEEKMNKIERYFTSHGEVSIFTGRLIPGVRHVISFPAGLGRMDLKKFTLYTTAGGSIWMFVLVGVGYVIGGNKQLVHDLMPQITAMAIGAVALTVLLYIRNHRKKNPEGKE